MEKERPNECNGWENYETWIVKLWLDNDEKTQKWFEKKIKDSISSLSDKGKIWKYHYNLRQYRY